VAERPDLTALLDVTAQEPPEESSPLWVLENVELTPHVAGSMGRTVGDGPLVAAELRRWTAEVLQHRIDPTSLDRIA
jgi:phosphoglycerate dehydrogenase-like enzyme